jgi:hypothetical protein
MVVCLERDIPIQRNATRNENEKNCKREWNEKKKDERKGMRKKGGTTVMAILDSRSTLNSQLSTLSRRATRGHYGGPRGVKKEEKKEARKEGRKGEMRRTEVWMVY